MINQKGRVRWLISNSLLPEEQRSAVFDENLVHATDHDLRKIAETRHVLVDGIHLTSAQKQAMPFSQILIVASKDGDVVTPRLICALKNGTKLNYKDVLNSVKDSLLKFGSLPLEKTLFSAFRLFTWISLVVS